MILVKIWFMINSLDGDWVKVDSKLVIVGPELNMVGSKLNIVGSSLNIVGSKLAIVGSKLNMVGSKLAARDHLIYLGPPHLHQPFLYLLPPLLKREAFFRL